MSEGALVAVDAADEPRAPGRDRSRLTVAAVAVGLRAVAALLLSRTPVGLHDPLLYQRFAQGIAKGQGYQSFFGKPTAYYPPGYPFFLGGIQWICDRLGAAGSLPIAAGLVQAVLGGVTVWAVVGIGDALQAGAVRWGSTPSGAAPSGATPSHATPSGAVEAGLPPDPANSGEIGRGHHRASPRFGRATRRWGIVAGAIVAVWPNLVLHSTVLLSETLLLAVFAVFLLCAARLLTSDGFAPAPAIGAGVSLGLAVLVRPQVVLVVAALALAALAVRRTWPQRAAIVAVPAVVMVLTVAPWTIRNAGVFGELVAVSTNGGDNLCVGFHPKATGHFEIPPSCDTGEFYTDGPKAEARRNNETADRATRWVRSHLTALPALSARKLWYTYEHDHDGLRAVESYEQDRFLPGPVRTLLQWTSDLFYAAVMIAAVAGAVLLTRRWWTQRSDAVTLFVLVAALTSALVPILFFGEARFKVPTTPLFALLAAPAVAALQMRRNLSDQNDPSALDLAEEAT